MNYEERIGQASPERRLACFYLLYSVIEDHPPTVSDAVAFALNQLPMSEFQARRITRSWSQELGRLAGKDCRPWQQAIQLGIKDDYIDAIRERMSYLEQAE